MANNSAPKKKPRQRLSLVERQQQLLEEKGFSSGSRSAPLSRQDELLIKQGRGTATSASRKSIPMNEVFAPEENMDGDGGGDVEKGSTMTGGGKSYAPSLHPSMAGTVRSVACSEVTIGIGF